MKNVIEKKSSTAAASNAVHDINQQIKEDCLRVIQFQNICIYFVKNVFIQKF